MRFPAGDYEKKNRGFFAQLISSAENTEIVYYADGNEYYDVLGIVGEKKLEAIPAPVFAQITGLPTENHFEAIRGFLGEWFGVSRRTRDEWSNLSESDNMSP